MFLISYKYAALAVGKLITKLQSVSSIYVKILDKRAEGCFLFSTAFFEQCTPDDS